MAGDFELTTEDLQVVARYVAESAAEVLPIFAAECPDDPRPRLALDAAWTFVESGRRTKLQRVTSLDAHRAAKSAPSEVARLAARCAGDAASAAYLHPLYDAAQVGHILRAPATVARIAELVEGDGEAALTRAVSRATPDLIDVLRRYPVVPVGQSPVASLMSTLDARLR